MLDFPISAAPGRSRVGRTALVVAALAALVTPPVQADDPHPIFNGKTFAGWEGDAKTTWRIEDGAIVGGSLEKTVPRNEFLATLKEYEDFELSLKYKIVGTEGFINGGVQFRSKRIPNHHEVSGYQADLGMRHDGTLYDESRRKRALAKPSEEIVAKALKPDDWNEYRIRAEGPRIRLWLNGTLTVDYTEAEPAIDRKGMIALQIHGGCKAVVRYKDIKIQSFGGTGRAVSRFGSMAPRRDVRGPFPGGRFVLETCDVVAFTGQTDTVRSRQDGTLESLLALEFAAARPRFRNMAWEGDTVYEQWRDLNFGTWANQLDSAGATVVFAQFGQMESLDGPDRLGAFVTAYEALLDQFATRTRRIVLISPRPFEKPVSPHMPDHTGMNETVRHYARAIRDLAERREYLFVDLFSPTSQAGTMLTTNGIHLNREAHRVVGRIIARSLGTPIRAPESVGDLQVAIREKNRLWFDNWRPMNWTFAFGNRTEQPFGKPGGGKPALYIELEEFQPLIAAADAHVHDLAAAFRDGGAPRKAEPPPIVTAPVALAPANGADHSPEAEQRSFTLARGFAVNLFASEADSVVKPLQMRWDDRGRLWVLCAPTYPQIDPGAKPGDYVLVCEDTDGDGRADRFHRFAEGLFMPMGIEFGDRGVYLTEATELVHLKDNDGDGKANTRTVVLSGFGTADSHQMINGLERGPGGELWFTQGHHAYSRIETPWGISRLDMSGIWRFRPRTGRLDGFFSQMSAGSNCHGVTHDDWGQTFHNSAARSGGFYTVPGMVATPRPLPYWAMAVPDRRNTGIEFLGTRHLPDDLQGCVVWGGFMSSTVQLHRLTDDGAGFTAKVLPDLLRSSGRDFRPVDVRVGPDGAIYVCDWYNAVIGHYQASYRDPARDKAHGRIWRITAKGRPPASRPDLAGMAPAALLEQLRSPERLTRHNAKTRLFDLPTAAVVDATDAFLAKLDAADPQYEHLLYELIGVYEAHEALRPDLLAKLLGARDARARAYGARVVGRWADRLSDPLAQLRTMVHDEHPRVRLEAVVACGAVRRAAAIEVAAQAIDMAHDRHIDYALSQVVNVLKPLWAPALARGELRFGNRLDRLRFVLESDGTKDVAGLVRGLAGRSDLDAAGRDRVLALLVNVGTADDLRYAFDSAPRSAGVLDELAAVASIHGKRPAGDLAGPLRALLAAADPGLRARSLRLAGVWSVRSLTPAAQAELARAEAPAAVRAAALSAVGMLLGREALPLIEPFARADYVHEVQAAAVSALAALDLERASLAASTLMPAATTDARMADLMTPLLNRRGGSDALANVLSARSFAADPAKLALRVLTAAGRSDPALAGVLNRDIGVCAGARPYDAAFVKALADDALASGEARRGRAVFLTAVANCTACHKLDGKGGDTGPDLTLIGAGRTPQALAESVLWPNRQVREGFMATRIATASGQLLLGYKVKQTAEEIHLRDPSTGQVRRIAQADVEEAADAGSLMPEGLGTTMTRAELRDLVRFLSELGTAPRFDRPAQER